MTVPLPRSQRVAPIAIVDDARQIQVLDTHGALRPQTAAGDPALLWAAWSPAERALLRHAWPTWSPAGDRIACFATDEAGASQALILDVGGIGSVAVADLTERLPIYLFWSPAGDRIALLSQRTGSAPDRLHLAVAATTEPDSGRTLAEGSPLFFTWVDDRVAAFIGDPSTGSARIAVLPAASFGGTDVLGGQPGNFCAPVRIGQDLIYVQQRGPIATIVAARLDGSYDLRTIETLHGLVALVASPDGRRLARAVAPGGDGTPYRDLAIIDPEDGTISPVADEPCLAFVWSGQGDALLTAQVDTDRNLIAWTRIALSGRSEHLVDMYPTRDFGFYLRFFEQYCQSHPLVDPSGRTLLLAGGIEGHGDPHRTQGIWEFDLVDQRARRVADGVFAVHGPADRD